MEAQRLDDPSAFLERALPRLLAEEARHNLILGLAGTLRDRPGYYDDFRLWLVEDDGIVVGAALQTPPHNLVLAQPAREGALAALVDGMAEEDVELPGVVAAIPEADEFASGWESRRSVTRVLRRSQRIYRLTQVRPPRGVRGHPRLATPEDAELLISWVDAFAEEALPEESPSVSTTARMVYARLADPDAGFVLWEDPEPVSLAGFGGPTPSGIRIGPVYTPPHQRRRGYGSAVTAAVSADRLASGRRFCFLYTDLANPTSNGIYMDIGYEAVCDSAEYAFEP